MQQQLVGVREAAGLLGINASTVSRNLRDGIIPNRGTDRNPLVDVDEARTARANGTDPAKRRERLSKPGTSYQSARARREDAGAARAELELARLRGETLSRAEVADAAFQVGQLFREAVEARRAGLALRLAGIDAGAAGAMLADSDRALLTQLADLIEQHFKPSAEDKIAA